MAKDCSVMTIGEKLNLLAEWIDLKYPNDPDPEIQADLRKWGRELACVDDLSTVAARLRLADAVLAVTGQIDTDVARAIKKYHGETAKPA